MKKTIVTVLCLFAFGAAAFAQLPTPPSTAQTFSNIDDMTGWSSCSSYGCAGGKTGSYWMAPYQTTPSMDGSSTEFHTAGAGVDVLWWKKFGAHNAAKNFIWDFWVHLDNASLTGTQALEYDAFQFVGGYNYMIGSQCNYAAKVWDVWNEATNSWIHTTVPCPKFSANVWHHIQWYVQRVPNTHYYHYVTLVVDGHAYSINRTYPAKYLAWGDNLGVQYQLDVNSTGVGYHEWVDKSKFTIW